MSVGISNATLRLRCASGLSRWTRWLLSSGDVRLRRLPGAYQALRNPDCGGVFGPEREKVTILIMQTTKTKQEPVNPRRTVTVVIPCYNEAAVVAQNLREVLDYLATMEEEYEFEVIAVNDGSADETGAIVEQVRAEHSNLTVIHHPSNFGLGQAFKTAFAASTGEFVVTIDADLSYAPETIGALLTAIRKNHAKLALASPYMEGGQVTKVPFLRRVLSRAGNRLIAWFTGNEFSTFTCMVRAYDGPFIRTLEPKNEGMGIMPEVIYKTMVVGGKIVEVPAHLDWSRQLASKSGRSSSMRVLSHILSTFVSGFFFRPFMLMLIPGTLALVFSMYVNFWLLMDFLTALPLAQGRLSDAAELVYRNHGATLLIGMLSLLLAIQMISLGAVSLQAKRYYEEGYFQMVKLRRQIRQEIAEQLRQQGRDR